MCRKHNHLWWEAPGRITLDGEGVYQEGASPTLSKFTSFVSTVLPDDSHCLVWLNLTQQSQRPGVALVPGDSHVTVPTYLWMLQLCPLWIPDCSKVVFHDVLFIARKWVWSLKGKTISRAESFFRSCYLEVSLSESPRNFEIKGCAIWPMKYAMKSLLIWEAALSCDIKCRKEF